MPYTLFRYGNPTNIAAAPVRLLSDDEALDNEALDNEALVENAESVKTLIHGIDYSHCVDTDDEKSA